MAKTPLKIALFLPALNDGGAERVFVNLANGFTQKGHAVNLILIKNQGPYKAQAPHDITTTEIGRSPLKLANHLRRAKPDILISALPAANLMAIAACAISKTKLIITEHAFFSVYDDLAKSPKTKLRNAAMKHLYKGADQIMAVSQGAAEDLARACNIPTEKIKVIPNPIDLEAIKDRAGQPTNHPWFKNKQAPVILSAGRLSPPKDFKTLIYAFKKIQEDTEIKLIIIGEGVQRNDLQNLINNLNLQDRIDMPGFQSNPFNFMAAGDLFVLSSLKEGFGNVIIESLACGTPVIATNCPGGPAEILENGKWGTLVPPQNIEALAQAMEKGLETPPTINLQSRAADFAQDKIIDNYLQMIENVLHE
ncbi:glycosyltransferase [Alphaproteobacteria bacterium]|nr:glycosyltransferase [Alphaproteobacteria bacterium]